MVQKYDRFAIQEPETETNLAVSVAAGIGSGLIKIPLGLVSVAAELYDATQGEGVNYDESAVARLEKFIDDSVVGDVINGLEDKARDTAAGRITEALVQVGVPAARAAKIAGNIAVKTIGAIQKGKRVSTTGKQGKNLLKGAQKANELNRAARYSKYAATSVGGAGGAALVYDIEDIGTFGDIAPGIGTGLDRDATRDTEDDAIRKLENRAKFFAEGILLTPFVYGIGQGAKFLGKKGKELAYSNSKFERILDKFASTFRPRSKKSQELFEAQMRVEGQEGAAAIVAKDLVRDIDDSFKTIFDKSFTAAERVKNTDAILEGMDGLIRTGKDTIINNEVVFRNFDKKRLADFKKSLTNLKIPAAKQDK